MQHFGASGGAGGFPDQGGKALVPPQRKGRGRHRDLQPAGAAAKPAAAAGAQGPAGSLQAAGHDPGHPDRAGRMFRS